MTIKEELIEQYFDRELRNDGYTFLKRKSDGYTMPLQAIGLYTDNIVELIGKGDLTPKFLVD